MKKVSQLEVKDNVIDEFKFKHALVCARKKDGTFNMCTIAWGSIGELWNFRRRRNKKGKISAFGSSYDLCGSSSFFHFAVVTSSDLIWR